MQRTASSSSLGSSNGNPVEVKVENAGSLIDFDADPGPPVAAAVPQTQQTSMTQPTAHPSTSNNDNNWASFDAFPEAKVSQAPSNVNTLESVLSQLSVSASVPGHVFGTPGSAGSTAVPTGNMSILPITGDSAVASVGNTPALPFTAGAPVTAPISSLSMFPPGAQAISPGLTPILPVNGSNYVVKVPGSGQGPNMQYQQPSFFPATGIQSTAQQFTTSVDVVTSNQVSLWCGLHNLLLLFLTKWFFHLVALWAIW